MDISFLILNEPSASERSAYCLLALSSLAAFSCGKSSFETHRPSVRAVLLKAIATSFVPQGSLLRQFSQSQSVSNSRRWSNSASHSCRQSARKRRGTITPISRISQSQNRERFVRCISQSSHVVASRENERNFFLTAVCV